MGNFLNPSDVPGVDTSEATELIAELHSHLSLHYPCLDSLTDLAQLDSLRAMLVPIVRRWADGGTGLSVVETTGPFTERRGSGGGHVLWKHEAAALRKLCDAPTPGPPAPRGSFPPPQPMDDLFASRPTWQQPPFYG